MKTQHIVTEQTNLSKHLIDNSYQNKFKSIIKMKEIFSNLDTNIRTINTPEYRSLVNFSNCNKIPINRWFKYREGFSTDLIKKLIVSEKQQKRILDPFCGCGTTLVASTELKLESIGVDINPLATFVSKVKTRVYSEEDIKIIENHIIKILKNFNSLKFIEIPKLNIIDNVFNKDILNTLLKIQHQIKKIENEKYKNFLLLGWLAILEDVSNTYKEGNGIKYRFTKRTKKGYIKIPKKEWENKTFGKNKQQYVINTLKHKYSQMINDAKYNKSGDKEPVLYTKSALLLSDFIESDSISTAIFSPPYANCFDYFEIFKVELWMGGFIKNYTELKQLRDKALRSNTNCNLDVSRKQTNLKELDALISLMNEEKIWSNKLKKVIHGYFEDMNIVLEQLYDVLEPGGKCIIIVGNSAYGDVIFPTDLLLATIGKNIGFNNIEIKIVRHLTTSSQQKEKLLPIKEYLRESIIILHKPKENIEKVDELPLNQNIPRGQKFIITSNNVANYTHNFHKYPAKFIPQIPRWGILKYQQKGRPNIILDPFCGSGTTLVEGLRYGHIPYGIDIDPLSRLISKVKTTYIEKDKLLKIKNAVVSEIKHRDKSKFKPHISTINHWFNDESIKKLSIIRDVIDEYHADKDVYDFLIICLSSIIRRVSNADNQSQKTYVSHTNPKKPDEVYTLFFRTLNTYCERLIELFTDISNKRKAFVLDDITDSRNFSKCWKKSIGKNVDIAITSPPYIKAIDYVYNQMAELFWIGDLWNIETQELQNKFKTIYIGTKQIFSDEYKCRLSTDYRSIDELTERIYKKDKKFAYITAKFFIDMEKNIREVYNVLRNEGHYIIVIGNNNISGIPINSNELLVEIAQNNGFNLNNLFFYKIRNRYMRFPRNGRGGIIKDDWVIDLEKT